jgi:hypothetical protein
MEKPRKEKLKNPLPDYLRGELSDPAHGTQQLQTTTPCRVRCSAWLGITVSLSL